MIKNFWKDECGALYSLEQVLGAALLVLGVGVGMESVRDSTNNLYFEIAARIDQYTTTNMPKSSISIQQPHSGGLILGQNP